MIPGGFIGRADLLRAFSELDDEAREAAADLLGYVVQPRRKPKPDIVFDGAQETVVASGHTVKLEDETATRPLLPTPFWRLEKYTARRPVRSRKRRRASKPEWQNRPKEPPRYYWLDSWRNLGPRLLGALHASGPGSEYDLDRAVDVLARGESISLLPREERPRPLPQVQIVFDRSSHLIPYWFDQDLVAEVLKKKFGGHAVEKAFVQETADEPSLEHPEADGCYRLPPPGSAVLVLGDLGCLSPAPHRENSWARLGRRARAAGCRPIALVPAPIDLVSHRLRATWQLIEWEQRRGEILLDRSERQKRARRLLALLSHAFRIEPGLLRATRLALGAEGGDAGMEAEAWAQLKRQHPSAGTLDDPKLAEKLQQEFAEEEVQIKREILARQHEWRQAAAAEIWFDEVINLPAESQALLPHPEDAAQSRNFFSFAERLAKSAGASSAAMASWLANMVEPRATKNAWSIPEFARAIYEVKKDDSDFKLPGNVDPANIRAPKWFSGTLKFQLGQNCLDVQPASGANSLGASHLGTIASENGILTHSVIVERPNPALFWADRQAPSWASDWGEDEFGLYAEFSLGGVAQRLRWIPAGSFFMGSPEDEAGRYDNEGPRQKVTLTSGFWMLDTPVRQSLWLAIMDENPSRFVSPNRPVECIDYVMIEQFLARLNDRIPGLDLALPSEAQWEYACRAGTGTATYGGDLEILGENNSPALDEMAWYGGNSGVGFELDDGEDSSHWDKKQYPDSPSGSHPVRQKRANAFGLFDMLGNVWEWCADRWHSDHERASAALPQRLQRQPDTNSSKLRELQNSILRIYEACKAPPIPPSEYQLLFTLIATEVQERGYSPQKTAPAIVMRARREGSRISMKDVSFVLHAIDEITPWLEHRHSSAALARAYRDFVLMKCDQAGVRLTEDEHQLVQVWFIVNQGAQDNEGTALTGLSALAAGRAARLTEGDSAYRVVRGGSWSDDAGLVRAACRGNVHPEERYSTVGFRCVRVQTSGKQSVIPVDRGAARQAERRTAVRSLGARETALCLTPGKSAGSIKLPPMGRLRIVSDRAELEFAQIGRPVWATHMGCDVYGLFAEFKIGEVVQRLRWIPPGSFLMGSPDAGEGRLKYEGPRHEVILGAGFWMMDTPVRQSLWLAVMDENPSRFVSPARPVESADYTMIEQFLSRLNSRITGLDLSLPSEAQWEFACRAGTGTATYAGDLKIMGECNAPVLDEIAWYGGNSGVGFELENGDDSSNWAKKQYPDSQSGTHPVAQKRANSFGLFDMLGNVWEWCADHWHDGYKGALADGSARPTENATAHRVLRGGSWNNHARNVRPLPAQRPPGGSPQPRRLPLCPSSRSTSGGGQAVNQASGAAWPQPVR